MSTTHFPSVPSFGRSLRGGVIALVATAALGASSLAQAGNVYWSVGVQSPGVVVGLGSAPPVMYAPAPVYMAPPPVVVPAYPVGGPPHKHWKRHKHGHWAPGYYAEVREPRWGDERHHRRDWDGRGHGGDRHWR